MNTSNQKLIRGIKIFFKAAQIFIIVTFLFVLFAQILTFTVLKDFDLGSLSVIRYSTQPNTTLMINGQEQQAKAYMGFGAVVVEGVPLSLNIVNVLFMVGAFIIYFLIVKTIRSIVKAIEKGNIFSLNNIRRLKNIGLLLVLDLVLNDTIMIFNSMSIHTIDPGGTASVAGMIVGKSIGYIIAIVFTFFMAAVFKIGVNLQEENQSFV